MAALQTARDKVQELMDAAQAGSIIPFRLPGQIEEIQNLLAAAEQEMQEAVAAAKASAGSGAEVEATLDEEARQKFGDDEEAYFVGHAVHELRTPMTSIRGYTDMLSSVGELSDMQQQFIGVIKTNTRRMEGLLHDVSHINKIRRGVLKLQPKMDIFKNIAEKVIKELAPRAEELNRTLETDIPQGLPLLNVDGEMLSVALTKLVENALQYSPEGEGKVTIAGSADEVGNLVIQIRDNGIGMSEDEMAQLGRIYFRGDRDEVREFKGSGLGIPIAYGILELLEAQVDVASALGEGTTFTIRIAGLS